MKKIQNNNHGFTLLELLVVVLIIGVLAAIALPQYRKAVGKAEFAQLINATKVIQNAQERFYLTNGSYADSLDDLDVNLQNSNITSVLSPGDYSVCYNKNYILIHYYAQTDNKNGVECYAKDKTLATACESFLNRNAQSLTSAWCSYMGETSCYKTSYVKLPM